MKHVSKYPILCGFIFWVMVSVLACQKEQQTAEQIQGVWRQTFAPHSIYTFDGTLCTQRVIALESEVYRNEYAYTCEGDIMKLTDIADGSTHTWQINITSDSTCEIRTESPFVLNLKKYPW